MSHSERETSRFIRYSSDSSHIVIYSCTQYSPIPVSVSVAVAVLLPVSVALAVAAAAVAVAVLALALVVRPPRVAVAVLHIFVPGVRLLRVKDGLLIGI